MTVNGYLYMEEGIFSSFIRYNRTSLFTVSLSKVTHGQPVWKYYVENSKNKKFNKQFISFQLHTILSSVMKYHADPFCPCVHSSPLSHLVAVRSTVSVPWCWCSSNPFFTCWWPKSSNASNSDMPKRSCKSFF